MAQQPSKASSAARDAVTSLVSPVVESCGLVLEDVSITPAGKRRVVRIVVDLPSGPGSLDLDGVAEVASAVSRSLDEAEEAGSGRGPLGGSPYVLEVTSPGVDRPLTEPRHWSRATGRLVRTTVAGRTVTARVAEVLGGAVHLEGEGIDTAVEWADLGPGAVQVEFNRPDDLADTRDATDETDETDEEDA